MGRTRVTGASTGGKESTGDKAVAARAAQGKPGEEEELQKPERGVSGRGEVGCNNLNAAMKEAL